MTTAEVTILGEPAGPAGLPWEAQAVLLLDGKELRFQVPTNRKLRITVQDWYGRDLKTTYESTHSPGLTPIHQDSTITVPKNPAEPDR